MPASETAFLARHLFAGAEGRRAVARIDRRLSGLPGLAELTVVEPAARRWIGHIAA